MGQGIGVKDVAIGSNVAIGVGAGVSVGLEVGVGSGRGVNVGESVKVGRGVRVGSGRGVSVGESVKVGCGVRVGNVAIDVVFVASSHATNNKFANTRRIRNRLNLITSLCTYCIDIDEVIAGSD